MFPPFSSMVRFRVKGGWTDGLGAGTSRRASAVANGGYSKLCEEISSLVWLVRSTEFSILLVLRQIRRFRNAHSTLALWRTSTQILT